MVRRLSRSVGLPELCGRDMTVMSSILAEAELLASAVATVEVGSEVDVDGVAVPRLLPALRRKIVPSVIA